MAEEVFVNKGKMFKVTIDGTAYEAPEGANVLGVCLANGVDLEHFCYHPYLPKDGNCRTCMIEIAGPRGNMLTIGCNTMVTDGMVVFTTSEKAKEAQKSALEFMLLDHPLDCPVCDKAGECRLQNNYMSYGQYEARRTVPRFFKDGKAIDVGDHIILDQERCILCTRCVRFLDTIPETSELGILHRGHKASISIFEGQPIRNDYSGNVTDVCPVGALTLKEFRFQQRVWFLKKAKSICPFCARGCNITIEHNHGKVFRFMPRENRNLNRAWICDDGRFSFKKINHNRLLQAKKLGNEIDTVEALAGIVDLLKNSAKEKIGTLVSPFATTETIYVIHKIFSELNSTNIAPIVPVPGKGDELLKMAALSPNESSLAMFGIKGNVSDVLKKSKDGVLIIIEPTPEITSGIKETLPANTIVISSWESELTINALYAIPVRSFAETFGTFINGSGKMQKIHQAFAPHGINEITDSASLLWQLFNNAEYPVLPELGKLFSGVLIGQKVPYVFYGNLQNEFIKAAFGEMAKSITLLNGLSIDSLSDHGIDLDLGLGDELPFRNINPDPNIIPIPGRIAS